MHRLKQPPWFFSEATLNTYAPGPLAESAFHLLTVIDFLCLAGGTYLLLILHDRRPRSGYLLTAAGLAVMTLQIIPEHLAAAAPRLRYAGATLSLGVACLLIVAGTLALIEKRADQRGSSVHRSLLVLAATLTVLGTFFVWLLPFWEPLRGVIRQAPADGAFFTFQQGLRVGVAAAFLACTWITWERRVLGDEVSRMFGIAYLCWAAVLILSVTALGGPEGNMWAGRGLKVLGSLFVGNALVLHVFRSERAATERQRRLGLIDRVTRAAIASPRLLPMIEDATREVRDLLHAETTVTYLVDSDQREHIQRASCADDCAGLPKQLLRSDDHPIVRALEEREPRRITLEMQDVADDDARLDGFAVPLTGLAQAVGVMVVGMDPANPLTEDDVTAVHNAGAQLGVIIQHMMLLETTRQERDRWRQTFDSITELVTVHNERAAIAAANQAALSFAGVTEREALGKSLCDVFGEEAREQQEMLEVCIRTGGPPGIGMHRARGRVYQVQVTPLRDDDRRVFGCVRVARDVTSRWRAEGRLAQSERRYRELAEGANDIIYTHDLEGHFLYVNPAAVRILGYSQEQFSHLKFWDIVAPESMAKARAYVQDLLEGRPHDEQSELRMTCHDGRVAIVQLRANVLKRSGQSEAVHGIARDVTAEKQLTTQLIQADRLASVGTLIAGVAHELNNPLTAISGYADLLAGEQHDGDEANAISTIAEEAERCRIVAQNLLNFARQTDGRLTELDLNMLIRGVFDLRAYDLRSARIDVKTDFQDDLPAIVGEYGQIQQVVYNLIDNAYQAMYRQDSGTVEVATWDDDGLVHVRVADSGPGIPEDLLDRIFEPFVTTKPRGEGTGLGLSICLRILEDHNGRITASNRPGGGASFDAVIPARGSCPVETVEEPMATAEDQATDGPAKLDGPTRILFIDDEPSLCALVKEYLTRVGHDVTVVSTGEEGLTLATEQDFGVIICDMRLPGISGEDVCMTLLEEKPEAVERMVVATGDILSPQTQSFFDRTGLPHIHKPFKLDQLEDEIARIMQGRPIERS